jgi:hypothetical protein
MFDSKLSRLAHIKQESVFYGFPMNDRHVVSEDVGCYHPCEVDWIFCASELGRVAQLSFLEVLHGCAHLDESGKDTDTFIHTVPAECLCSEESPVGFPE